MNQQSTLHPCTGLKTATNGAALAAPSYATATNQPFEATDGNKTGKRTLIKLAAVATGTGNVVITVWYCDPLSGQVFIADDVALAGVWTVAVAGANKNVAILVDNHGFDIGVSITVSAVNITAAVTATATELT